jgi:rsbT co-antagonist protein RsbR
MNNSLYSIPPSDWKSFELLQNVFDTFDDPIFVKDLQHRWVACNQPFCTLLGQRYDAVLGRSDPDFWRPEEAKLFWDIDDQVISSGQPIKNEEPLTSADGVQHTVWTRKYPLRDAGGTIIGLCGIITDITAIKQRQQEVEHLENAIKEKISIIEAQGSLLDQLAVPVIQVWESVLLLPLVGVIDSRRAAQVLENLLESIARTSTEVVILDITGVPVVDTSVASYLVRAVQASQLLGCESILVGISAEIAQTLVGLGVDFSRITTRATLQNGLEYALKRLSYGVSRIARH